MTDDIRLRLTLDVIKRIERVAHALIKDRSELKRFIFDSNIPDITLDIPDELLNPRDYDASDYPMAPNENKFANDHPYDYLTTFRIASFYKYKENNPDDLSLEHITRILEVHQCQSRLSNIWRQLAAVMLANDIAYGVDNTLRRMVTTFYRRIGAITATSDMPFYENHNRFIFTNTEMASVIPLLTYGLTSLGAHRLASAVTNDELILCFENYMYMARRAYQDTKLRLKSASRSWLIEALHNLGEVAVPIWGEDMKVHGMRLKKLAEPAFIVETFAKAKLEREKELYSKLNTYIKASLKLKNQPELLRHFVVTRIASNDGTYYKTATVLSLAKAVEPQIRERVVSAPIELKAYAHGTIDQTYRDQTPEKEVVDSLLCYSEMTLRRVEQMDPDEVMLDMLKMTSAGIQMNKDVEKNAVPVSRTMKQLSTKRLIVAADESHLFRDINHYLARLGAETKAVERQQPDRRQRMIAGINNEKLYGSIGSYIILKALFEGMSAAAQGKQTGNALDIFDMIKWSAMNDVLLSSADVKGMDASVQTTTRDLIHTFILKVAQSTSHRIAGPFTRNAYTTVDKTSGERSVTREELSALLQLIVVEKANSQTSVMYDDRIFGRIKNAEGTFSSGRADTSAHHTALLPAIILASEFRQSATVPNTRSMRRALGDDMNVVYCGRADIMEKNMKYDSQAMNEIGFTIEEEVSRNSMVFLQQHCVNGTFVGYPDRIILFTKERVSETTSKLSVVQELRALCDDLCWRTVNMQGLRLMMMIVLYVCVSRITIKVEKEITDSLLSILNEFVPAYGYEDASAERTTRLISFHLPLMWMFMEKGGELPAFGVERSDGSFSCEESIHTPRGKFKRKLIYDICNVGGRYDLDHQWLKKLGVTAAVRVIALNVVGNEFDIKRTDFDRRTLAEYGRKLETITDPAKYEYSRRRVAELRRRGFHVPSEVVYGERLTERILQAAEAMPLTEGQRRRFGTVLLESARRARNMHFQPEKNDDMYKLTLIPTDIPLSVQNICFLAHDVQISLNTHITSESTSALQMLGYVGSIGGAVRSEVNASRGVYANFKYDDPMFRVAYEIWTKDKSLLPVFFDVIQASNQTQIALTRALAYYHMNFNHQYLLSLSPRNLFFIAEQPSDLQSNIVEMPAVNKMGLLQAILYAELLRVAYENNGCKYRVRADMSLLKRLRISTVEEASFESV